MSQELTIAEQPQQLLSIEPKRYVELVFEPFAKQLEDAKALAAVIDDFDVTTTAGMAVAVKHRALFRDIRVASEKARKERKAPILEIGRLLDSRQAQLEAEIAPFESRFDKAIKAEEARKEAEKQARIAAEMKRVADLQERVAELRGCPTLSPTSGSALIAEHIGDLEGIAVDESFQEMQEQAMAAKTAGLSRLRELHAAAVAHEAEQERIRQEREELARLRQESARREAEECARLAEEERRAKEQREREAAEQRRVSSLRERLADLRAQATIPATWTSAQIDAQYTLVSGLSTDAEVWQEFANQAESARADALDSLRTLRDAAITRETDDKRVREERAELDRQRREHEQRQAEIDRRERETREAEERRVAAERAETARKEREAAEARAREERRQKARENPPPAMDIVKTVAVEYDVEIDVAMEWLTTLDFSEIDISEAA